MVVVRDLALDKKERLQCHQVMLKMQRNQRSSTGKRGDLVTSEGRKIYSGPKYQHSLLTLSLAA